MPLLIEADLTIVNLECVIASTSRPWSRWPKAFHFRADPLAIDALKRAGVDCVVLANNHVLDYEEPALLEMLELLERNGLAFAGAGRDLEEARRPAVLDARGVKVGGWPSPTTSRAERPPRRPPAPATSRSRRRSRRWARCRRGSPAPARRGRTWWSSRSTRAQT